MSHASHFSRAGAALYANFVNAELNEITPTIGNNPPYGTGNNNNSPIIALGEGWAFFMGHFLADRRYAANSSNAVEQQQLYRNNDPVLGLSSHSNLL